MTRRSLFGLVIGALFAPKRCTVRMMAFDDTDVYPPDLHGCFVADGISLPPVRFGTSTADQRVRFDFSERKHR